MGKGHQRGLRLRIESEGKAAKGAARNGDPNGQIKSSNMAPERLRQCLEKPTKRANFSLALTRFVDLAITARYEVFEIAECDRFGGERAHAGKVRRCALEQQMETAKLVEAHPQVRLGFESVQQALELSPMRPLARKKTLKINDHDENGIMENWNIGILESIPAKSIA